MKHGTKQKVKDWINCHDPMATTFKIWESMGKIRFICCKGQQSYGETFTWDEQTNNVV